MLFDPPHTLLGELEFEGGGQEGMRVLSAQVEEEER